MNLRIISTSLEFRKTRQPWSPEPTVHWIKGTHIRSTKVINYFKGQNIKSELFSYILYYLRFSKMPVKTLLSTQKWSLQYILDRVLLKLNFEEILQLPPVPAEQFWTILILFQKTYDQKGDLKECTLRYCIHASAHIFTSWVELRC